MVWIPRKKRMPFNWKLKSPSQEMEPPSKKCDGPAKKNGSDQGRQKLMVAKLGGKSVALLRPLARNTGDDQSADKKTHTPGE